MLRFFLIACLFISSVAQAQSTRKVTESIKIENRSKPNVEEYRVLTEDGKTRHGLYKKFNHSGRILLKGYYKNGKKDSLWTAYSNWSNFVYSEGYYNDGKKTGIWIFHKTNDTVELRYDFDKKEVLYCKNDTSAKSVVLSGADTSKIALDTPPLYLGGSGAISSVISDNINYPDDARENGIQGRVLVGFTIYADGHASAPWVYESINKMIDDEALRVTGKIPPEWAAGMLNGKPVTSVYILPVTFKME